MASPTQRTLARLRETPGVSADVVEKWIPQARRRKDVAGCIDVVAYGRPVGVLGVQTTSATNHAARRTKALAEPRLRQWLAGQARFEIWSWRKVKARWVCRVEAVTLADLGPKPAAACRPCADCGEPFCDDCDLHYADCACKGPHSEEDDDR